MTLFITTPKRQLEIDDAYVVALSFLIAFAVGKIVKAVIEKQKRRKNIRIANPRWRNITIGLELSDDTELSNIILSCISNNECYMSKDPKIIQDLWRFGFLGSHVQRDSGG